MSDAWDSHTLWWICEQPFLRLLELRCIISTRTLSRQPGHGPNDHCGGREVEKTLAVHSEIPVSGALNTRMWPVSVTWKPIHDLRQYWTTKTWFRTHWVYCGSCLKIGIKDCQGWRRVQGMDLTCKCQNGCREQILSQQLLLDVKMVKDSCRSAAVCSHYQCKCNWQNCLLWKLNKPTMKQLLLLQKIWVTINIPWA